MKSAVTVTSTVAKCSEVAGRIEKVEMSREASYNGQMNKMKLLLRDITARVIHLRFNRE